MLHHVIGELWYSDVALPKNTPLAIAWDFQASSRDSDSQDHNEQLNTHTSGCRSVT